MTLSVWWLYSESFLLKRNKTELIRYIRSLEVEHRAAHQKSVNLDKVVTKQTEELMFTNMELESCRGLASEDKLLLEHTQKENIALSAKVEILLEIIKGAIWLQK